MAPQPKPIVAQTDLGELTLRRALGWFSGPATFGASTIEVTLDAQGESVAPLALETAATLYANQRDWSAVALAGAAEKLLPLYNDGWRKRFRQRLIHVTEEGDFSFWYDDDGLFQGHDIEVGCSLTEGAVRAGI